MDAWNEVNTIRKDKMPETKHRSVNVEIFIKPL